MKSNQERQKNRSRRIEEIQGTVKSTLATLVELVPNINFQSQVEKNEELISQPRPKLDQMNDETRHDMPQSRSSSSSSFSPVVNGTSQIPVLPKGRILRLEILSNWGDDFYLGFNGIDIFDKEGAILKHGREILKITGNPSDINVLEEYANDPRIVSNLLTPPNFTRSDLYCWLAPMGCFSGRSGGTGVIAEVTITFKESTSLSMLRVFNYNKSRAHCQRGIRHCRILLDDIPIFEGYVTT